MVRHSDSTQLSSTPLSVIQPCVCACATRSRPILYWVRGVYRRCWGTALQQACFCLTSAPPSRPPFPLPHCWSANRPPFSDQVCRCIRHAMQAPFLLKATPPPIVPPSDRTRRLARFPSSERLESRVLARNTRIRTGTILPLCLPSFAPLETINIPFPSHTPPPQRALAGT